MQRAFKLVAPVLALVFSNPLLAASYDVDPTHSFVQFKISHLGFSTLVGRFNTVTGNYSWDPAKPDSSAIEVTVDTTTIDTNHAERDKHLRSADFLNVGKFPTATFKSTGFKGDKSGGELSGELTLHGVTKPIVMTVSAVGEGTDPWGGYRSGFTGTMQLKRADFGISYDLGPAAEVMEMELFIEGTRK